MSETKAGGLAEELQYRELLLTEAERIVHLGSWMWNTATNAIRWSDELFRIYGIEPRSEEPTVELFFGGVHADDLDRVREVTGRGLATGSPEAIDFRVVRRDGSVRQVHMEAALVRREDSMLLVGSVLDTTERLELESRLRHSQKMEAVGTLAGGVAHDFNNYLQVIFGHVELALVSPALDLRTRASLEQVRDAALRCQRLTHQLLVFSRRNHVVTETITVEEILDRAEPMLETLAGDRVRLRRVRSRENLRVVCDPSSVEQVLMNLVANARDAMPRGGRITLETEARIVAEDGARLTRGRYACIRVADEGTGMCPEVLARAFEPFFTTKESGHGTGLGLATSWGIAQQNGGTLEVASESGRGTTVTLVLPLADDSVFESAPRGVESAATVLVVEDQPQVRRLVRFMLEAEGHAVLEAEHGLDALRVLRDREDVALVLTDVSMPEMSGIELARQLATDRRDLPVILMSALFDPSVEQIDAPLLRKPFERAELVRLVATQLGRGA